MKDIILEAREIKGVVFDLGELTRRLNQLTDRRDNRGKVYSSGSLLSMIVLARLSGADKPWAIYEWIRYHRRAFVKLYELKDTWPDETGSPSPIVQTHGVTRS